MVRIYTLLSGDRCVEFDVDYEKYQTCPVNRKVKSIAGSVFVFVSREAVILAQNALETVWRPGPLVELTTLPQTP